MYKYKHEIYMCNVNLNPDIILGTKLSNTNLNKYLYKINLSQLGIKVQLIKARNCVKKLIIHLICLKNCLNIKFSPHKYTDFV